jgi:hypothetical protein
VVQDTDTSPVKLPFYESGGRWGSNPRLRRVRFSLAKDFAGGADCRNLVAVGWDFESRLGAISPWLFVTQVRPDANEDYGRQNGALSRDCSKTTGRMVRWERCNAFRVINLRSLMLLRSTRRISRREKGRGASTPLA